MRAKIGINHRGGQLGFPFDITLANIVLTNFHGMVCIEIVGKKFISIYFYFLFIHLMVRLVSVLSDKICDS